MKQYLGNMKKYIAYCLCFLWIVNGYSQKYKTVNANAEFVSDAPLEFISAKSEALHGVLDIDAGEYVFKVYIRSFDGFNSPLQKEHFYENFMEVKLHPYSIFRGKLLEPYKGEGDYRAKGILEIHGIKQERIIDVTIQKIENKIQFRSEFEVPLEDHSIEIPKIVYQKIAEIIHVKVDGQLSEIE